MALNKKEKEYMESIERLAALHITPSVFCDVMPPSNEDLSVGYTYNSHSLLIEESCSSSTRHSKGRSDKTQSQLPIEMYSSKEMALRAMRNEIEKQFAKDLRYVDLMINKEVKL